MTTFRGKRGIQQSHVVWIAKYGDIPKGYVVDHINERRNDNRLENLRLLTKQQNTIRRAPEQGFKYVTNNSEVRVRMSIDGKSKTMIKKKFKTQIEAARAADKWWIEECPDEIKYEHDLPGNVPGRFIPYLNFQ